MSMTKGEMASWVAEQLDVTKAAAKGFLDDLTDLVVSELKGEGEFKFHDLLTLKMVHQEKRKGRNPATGESMTIPAKNVVRAKISKPLKDAVN